MPDHEERRIQLAESALQTLGELGYAGTSLREIAARSPFSHGVVHYYFRDKMELISFCVRHYKQTCVGRYDQVLADATTADELADGFVATLSATVEFEAPMHRLWYDVRNRSQFEPGLREVSAWVDGLTERMIDRVIERYAALAGRPLAIDAATAYPLLDGVVEHALVALRDEDPAAMKTLEERVHALLPLMLA